MKKYVKPTLSLLLTLPLIATAFIGNVYGIIIAGILSIIIFALRDKLVEGSVIAYIITLFTIVLRCSQHYHFKSAIVLSWSYLFVTMAICVGFALITFVYNCIDVKKN